MCSQCVCGVVPLEDRIRMPRRPPQSLVLRFQSRMPGQAARVTTADLNLEQLQFSESKGSHAPPGPRPRLSLLAKAALEGDIELSRCSSPTLNCNPRPRRALSQQLQPARALPPHVHAPRAVDVPCVPLRSNSSAMAMTTDALLQRRLSFATVSAFACTSVPVDVVVIDCMPYDPQLCFAVRLRWYHSGQAPAAPTTSGAIPEPNAAANHPRQRSKLAAQ